MSKWKRSSSSIARATRRASGSIRKKRRMPRGSTGDWWLVVWWSARRLCDLQNLEDGARITSEDVRLAPELFPADGRELVVLGFAVVLGQSPLAREQAALFHAVKGGVERALLDLKVV